MGASDSDVIRQHLIDPEICIRCNTCEATCPVGAVTHDSQNYVVDPDKCNFCMDCIAPCPTGSIDNWRTVLKLRAYSVEDQLQWDELPAEEPVQLATDEPGRPPAAGQGGAQSASDPQAADLTQAAGDPQAAADAQASHEAPAALRAEPVAPVADSVTGWPQAPVAVMPSRFGATMPPWSAAHAYTNLYGPKARARSIRATVTGNVRVTDVGHEYDTHHIVLDFGSVPFPVLEGQSIGVLPPGADAAGRPHHARQYSVSSPRNGERPGYNNLSLTVKRVLEDHAGSPVRGVASNYLCDLAVGDTVELIGPFGSSFLMPNHPRSSIVMICTGTGSAPMRAMTEWRRRLRASGKFEGGRLMLFFGARTLQELPYFGPLQKLPADFIDTTLALSRAPDRPRTYVQDAMRARGAELAALLADPDAFFYVCGLKGMEDGVMLALREIADDHGLDWESVSAGLRRDARLHLETY